MGGVIAKARPSRDVLIVLLGDPIRFAQGFGLGVKPGFRGPDAQLLRFDPRP
jgi:hypothetical protein